MRLFSKLNKYMFKLRCLLDRIPIIGHLDAIVLLSMGYNEQAKIALYSANLTTSKISDSIPVLGHIKGVVHKLRGDHACAMESFKAANRSAIVVAAGGLAFAFDRTHLETTAAGIISGQLLDALRGESKFHEIYLAATEFNEKGVFKRAINILLAFLDLCLTIASDATRARAGASITKFGISQYKRCLVRSMKSHDLKNAARLGLARRVGSYMKDSFQKIYSPHRLAKRVVKRKTRALCNKNRLARKQIREKHNSSSEHYSSEKSLISIQKPSICKIPENISIIWQYFARLLQLVISIFFFNTYISN